MIKGNVFKGFDFSPEAIAKRRQEAFVASNENPENMSYWLPKILNSTTKQETNLKIPETLVVRLDQEMWDWLRNDKYSPEGIQKFTDFVVDKMDNFREGQTLFMKSGIFSNKFDFHQTVVEDRSKIGKQFLDMFYTSMLVGADNTNEVVLREMIPNKDNHPTIYKGMPLHTEFRVFFDFDTYEVVGVSNYWHPEYMEKEKNLEEQDLTIYQQEKERILSEFDANKLQVVENVSLFMKGCNELSGKWSVDILKTADEFWLIDMARMQKSALVNQMESLT